MSHIQYLFHKLKSLFHSRAQKVTLCDAIVFSMDQEPEHWCIPYYLSRKILINIRLQTQLRIKIERGLLVNLFYIECNVPKEVFTLFEKIRIYRAMKRMTKKQSMSIHKRPSIVNKVFHL